MLITKEVEITWNNSNKKFFEEKGYVYTKRFDTFMCKVEDLQKNSEKVVEYICDYCGETNTKSYKNYISGKLADVSKDACCHCAAKKVHEIRKKNGKENNKKNISNKTKKELFLEKLHKKVKDKNYILFPYTYNNARQKLMYICNKHYNYGVQYAGAFDLSSDKCQCKGCIYDTASSVRRFDIDTVKNLIEKNGTNKLISHEYINANTRNLEILCAKCNKPYITSLNKFVCRNQTICPSCRLEITFGENAANWRGGISSLNNFLRTSIKEWTKDSLKNANYRCDICNKHGYLEVHHLHKNFKDIVEETLEITKLDIRENIGNYSNDELKLLADTCLDLHYKYGLGVCILREYHLDFHEFYGRFNNTLEQYYEFKKEMQKELFLNNKEQQESCLLCSNL